MPNIRGSHHHQAYAYGKVHVSTAAVPQQRWAPTGGFVWAWTTPCRRQEGIGGDETTADVDCRKCRRAIGAALDRFARSIGGARDSI
jgi:hypothetical protein